MTEHIDKWEAFLEGLSEDDYDKEMKLYEEIILDPDKGCSQYTDETKRLLNLFEVWEQKIQNKLKTPEFSEVKWDATCKSDKVQ